VLPSAEQGRQWQRISPLSIVFFSFGFIRQTVAQIIPIMVVSFAGIAKSERFNASLAYWGLGLLVLVLVVSAVLTWLRFRYCLSDGRVLVRKGVMKREELDIEFDRIQNINIRQPFYMRPFGLAALGIDTAGSAGKEVQLVGVRHGLALDIRSTILAALEHSSSADKHEAEAGREPGLLLELSRRDVLVYGLTANFLLWIALAMGAVFGTGEMVEPTLEWLAAKIQLDHLVDVARQRGGTLAVILGFMGAFLLVLVLLPLISMIGALFRYDGFRLEVTDETYRKSSGLLTRFDESIKRHKIQAVVWKQNILALLFGRVNLQLRQASAGEGVENGELPTGAKSQFLVPSLQPAQAGWLSSEFLRGCVPGNAVFSAINRRSYIRIHMLWLLLPMSVMVLAPAIIIAWQFLLLPLLAGGVQYLVLVRRWARYGYAIDGEYGYVRTGFIGSTTTLFPLFKVQRVDVQQTPSQRRKGLAYLTIHLASHSLEIPYVPAGDAFLFRDYALYAAESTHRKWY
jgi:putative membrane protein